MKKKLRKIFDGVFLAYNKIATKNLLPGKKFYGEELVKINETEYRFWNPDRSKISAAIKNGLKSFPIKKNSKILYLGCAEGTTVSHLSDIVEQKGLIFGLDISAKVMNKFLYLCSERQNLVPILADAAQPQTYKQELSGFKIDVLFQDISQKNQVKIFTENAKMHLKPKGKALLTIKARSISSTEDPKKIFKHEINEMKTYFNIKEIIRLDPFQKDHLLLSCEKK